MIELFRYHSNFNIKFMEQNSNFKFSIIVILLIISICTNIFSIFSIWQIVNDKILSIEYSKVGWKDNYDLINKAQKIQFQQQLPQIQQYIKNNDISSGSGNSNVQSSNQQLSPEKISNLKKNNFIEGNKDALISVIEYSDLECPFCIRQFKQGTLSDLHKKYGDKLNSIFKNIQGAPHENAKIEAIASMCAWKLGGIDKYSKFYKTIFTRTQGNWTGFSKDALSPLAEEIWLNKDDFDSCMKDNYDELSKQYDLNTKESSDFWIQGTPGTVIINNKTGNYMLVSGAVPTENFESAIDSLMK